MLVVGIGREPNSDRFDSEAARVRVRASATERPSVRGETIAPIAKPTESGMLGTSQCSP
jgi:hypothetical protein